MIRKNNAQANMCYGKSKDAVFSFDDHSIEVTSGIKPEMLRPEKY